MFYVLEEWGTHILFTNDKTVAQKTPSYCVVNSTGIIYFVRIKQIKQPLMRSAILTSKVTLSFVNNMIDK